MRIAAIATTALILLFSAQNGAVYSGNEVTLTGQFFWSHMKHSGDLDVVFTRTGDAVWDVEFRFIWEGDLHVYRGTAEGSLTAGDLRGKIITDNLLRPQTFFFAGTFEHGRFEGTHNALQASGGRHPTGTLTLGE